MRVNWFCLITHIFAEENFSPLDKGDIASNIDKIFVLALRSMRVTWFCLMTHIFAEEKVPSETIHVLVRLFLSSCRRLWIFGENLHLIQGTDENTSSKKPKSGNKRMPMKGHQQKKKSTPFYVTKANYLSL